LYNKSWEEEEEEEKRVTRRKRDCQSPRKRLRLFTSGSGELIFFSKMKGIVFYFCSSEKSRDGDKSSKQNEKKEG